MKVFAVIGRKSKEKEGFLTSIVQELSKEGYRVGVLEEEINMKPGLVYGETCLHKGCSLHGKYFGEETFLAFGEHLALPTLFDMLNLDYLILNGVKDKLAPKILWVEDEAPNKEDIDELVLCVTGPIPSRFLDFNEVPVLDYRGKLGELISLIEKKVSERLPGINCRRCGFNDCKSFEAAIIKGKATIDMCMVLNPRVELKFNGKEIKLHPFVQGLIRNVVLAIATSLKGYRKGDLVEIKVK